MTQQLRTNDLLFKEQMISSTCNKDFKNTFTIDYNINNKQRADVMPGASRKRVLASLAY